MTVTGLIDSKAIKTELVVFLRNNDIITVASRGVTTKTEEFNGTGAQTAFVMTSTPVRNVRTVTVGGVAQTRYTDYTVNYSTATVTFTTPPGAGTNNVDITYDYGNTDKIFPDFPRYDLGITSYPRIAVDITSKSTSEMAIGGKSTLTDFLISIYVYAEGIDTVDDYVKTIRQKMMENKTGFYYIPFITPITEGPLLSEDDRARKIMSKVIEFRGLFAVEDVS